MQEERIRVLIADDDASFVEALRVMLETDGRFTVVGAAANGEEAVRQVGELEPAVVAMDIVMPVMDGLEATRLIRDRSPGCQVVLVSGSIFQTRGEDGETAAKAVGASRYVLKSRAVLELGEVLAAAVELPTGA